MILLVVFLLTTPVPAATAGAWATGDYSANVFRFERLADCEARRVNLAKYLRSPEAAGHVAMVSQCATASDAAVFTFFGPDDASAETAPKIGV
jgi:hypothetical protein